MQAIRISGICCNHKSRVFSAEIEFLKKITKLLEEIRKTAVNVGVGSDIEKKGSIIEKYPSLKVGLHYRLSTRLFYLEVKTVALIFY